MHGSRAQPYRAGFRVPPLADTDWEALLEGVAAAPEQLEALLGGRLPEELTLGGVPLLPAPGELRPYCSCPDRGHPCKHAAALCFRTARLLDADPLLLLRLRGREERTVLADLQQRNDRLSAAPTVPAPGQDTGVPALHALTRGPSPAARLALPPLLPLPDLPGPAPTLPDTRGLATPATTLEVLAADAGRRAHAFLSACHAASPTARQEREPVADTPTTAPREADGGTPAGGKAVGGTPAGTRTGAAGTVPPSGARLFAAGLGTWRDAVRLAAALPTSGLTTTTRGLYRDLAAATGRTVEELVRSVAAWRQGEEEGLALQEETWDPPAGDFDRARGALSAAGLPALRPHRNRLTASDLGVQLRFGRDGRWYPYESEPGTADWWPAGRPHRDPTTVLRALLG
ncbi:SWIM zinc finger family protein [Streptomyces sp. NPDC059740]|uniref:SWIM zinc finger family protein n=1 Tax=Streptomyces sp. NPDC059740 TaxID=3346926 RepID=UPI0036604384